MYSCTLTFQTLLGSFVQRTSAQQPPSFPSAPFPLFCECKGTTFSFPSNTFSTFFSFIFYLFFISLKSNALQGRFCARFREKKPFFACFSLFFEDYRRFLSRKISQNRKIMTKTDAFRTSFLLLKERTVHDFGDGNGFWRRSLEYLIN